MTPQTRPASSTQPEQRVKRATIEDVARLAGVSRQTVSRAVNDKSEIDAETKRRVLDAARALNYRPSRFARGLIRQDTITLGLIISDIGNPFFPELASGVLRAAQSRDWQVVLYDTGDDPQREFRALTALASQADVGAGFLHSAAGLEHAAKLGVPFAVLDPGWGPGDDAPGVGIDFAYGVRQAVEHLAERGHTKVGMVDGAPDPGDARRVNFLSSARELGLDADGRVESTECSMDGGGAAVNRLLDRYPDTTAVFTYNDVLAIGALRAIRARGLRVPEDCAVIGFDGLPLGDLVEPPLTTVFVDIRRMGELAVEAAADLLAGRTPAPAVLRPELRIRASS